jgi:hypothetical protein
MKWILLVSSLLLTCLKDATAKVAKGRIFDYFGGNAGKSNADGIFVNNSALDFLIFFSIVGGILIIIGLIMAAWKAVRGPSDPSERGLLDSESEGGSDYNISGHKLGKNTYGITNPEEIFNDTKQFVERVGGENTSYQRLPENNSGDKINIDSSSHRMFDMFDRRQQRGGGGGNNASWGSNYQHMQEDEPQEYYNPPGYYRN